jgi:hypothetical protein
LELLDGPLAAPEDELRAPRRLAVAVDRRAFCRVERFEGGLEIHSKDTLQRVNAPDLARLSTATGPVARVKKALALAGVDSGARVVTQERVPEDAGLLVGAALSVALAAALDPDSGVPSTIARAAAVESALGSAAVLSDLHAAAFGGAHALSEVAAVRRLVVDPARLEECLLLVDAGLSGLDARRAPTVGPASASLVEALEAGRFDDVAGFLSRVHAGRLDEAPPGVSRVVRAIAAAGGAAWPCGRLVAVWAAPGSRSDGPREAVTAALREAGLRLFPVRVDVRGLEVE